MPGQKISSLSPVVDLQAADQLPLARSGSTYKITGDKFASKVQLDSLSATADNKFALKTNLNTLSANTINVVDSPTIDLTYNSVTRTLSADILTGSLNSIPTGAIMVFPCTVAPTGWFALAGQVLARATYSALWTFANSSGNIVTDAQWTSLRAYGAFSQGDGSSTFRLPDLRGHFVRGSGTHTDGTASGTFGVKQADDLRNHTHLINSSSVYTPNQNINGNFTDRVYDYANNTTGGRITSSTGGTETRPKNIALLACIKH